ncbi:MAG: type I 3-dehydroquinate dehydratase [Candidatus Methylacidiphilales bacterium]
MPKIKKATLKKKYLLVGTITTSKGLRHLSSPISECDLLEVRVDCLRREGMSGEEILEKLKGRKHPVLLTLRTTVEGGSYGWKSTERILMFEQLLPQADAVDLEMRNMVFVKPILQMARETGKVVVLSSHSLTRKLTWRKAQRLIEEFRSFRVDLYKLASLARTPEDLKLLVQVLIEYPKLRLSIMATGPQAHVSRSVLTALGSRMVYGYMDEPAAPGQPSIKEVITMLQSSGLR